MSRRALVLALALGTLLLAGGCRTMKRTLTIDSVPSGATIWVNGEKQASTTPVTIPFTWYGWWEVRLEMEGYQSLATEVEVKSRPDGYPIIDLPLERITPDYHVRRTLRLVPLDQEPEEADLKAVLDRAEALRDRAGAPRVPGSQR
ncbi:MAG: PEGA domain-containing protein [Planctomycetes bacterium]|nr:PEGA domain-containing protein [Planctomycetota bacterium]